MKRWSWDSKCNLYFFYTKSHPIRTELGFISISMSHVTCKHMECRWCRNAGTFMIQVIMHSEAGYVPILVPPDPCLAIQLCSFMPQLLRQQNLCVWMTSVSACGLCRMLLPTWCISKMSTTSHCHESFSESVHIHTGSPGWWDFKVP